MYSAIYNTSSKTNQNGDILFMDKISTYSLRGFSIFMIVFSHICEHNPEVAAVLFGGKYTYRILFSWGAIGVSVFFFLSGYGCYLSLINNDHKIKWLVQHICKMIIHYIFAFVFVITVLFIIYHQNICANDLAKCFLTLRLPGVSAWYFKIQILFYVILTLSMLIDKGKAWIIILFLSFLYVLIANYFLKLPDYWWKTSLCFFGGGFVALYKNKFASLFHGFISKILCIVLACISYIFIILDADFKIFIQLPAYLIISFSIVFVWCWIVRRNKIFSFLGKRSLDIYLIHIGLVEITFETIKNNRINIIAFLILSFALSLASFILSEKCYKFYLSRIVDKADYNK